MSDRALAHKYAQAFYDVYPNACKMNMLDAIKNVCTFFSAHKKVLFFLGLPQLDVQIKQDAIARILQELKAPIALSALFVLLIAQRRAVLIPRVCAQLRTLILQKNNTIECAITSVQELDAQERETLRAFFERETKHDIHAQYDIDKTLIAGIAMRSTTYAWEYSIRKQLHTIKQSLIR